MEAGCAVQNALLMAEALDLGAVWVGAFVRAPIASLIALMSC
jgi:nitroreductase